VTQPLPVARPWPPHQRLDLARAQARDAARDAATIELADRLVAAGGLPDWADGLARVLAEVAVVDAGLIRQQDAWLWVSGAAKLQQCQERLAEARGDLQRAEHEIALWRRPPTRQGGP
jgi:hypothetical protein